ncbi:dihydrofolate reductase family protein [Arthrobacter sp. CG_A4]|uniref:dihydrofolate reductase family protein n=1 Tax=Arthrobacter sp. CG_A4 TaxID=3071706 RepID=UPI002DFFB6E9|nr:dihydrofolate reductase [Arthrobacter sp. CG_A4]
MRRLVYYVATSIDGFIADPAGDVACFPVQSETLANIFARYPETCPGHLRETFGVTEAPRRFDTVIMGRRTHAPAVAAGLASGAYPHLRQIVVAHQDLPEPSGVEVMGGDIAVQIAELKNEPGLDIWLCGGGELAGQLVDLIDEIQLKINPVLLGSGIPLFGGDARPRELQAVGIEPLPGGVNLATYLTGTQRQE